MRKAIYCLLVVASLSAGTWSQPATAESRHSTTQRPAQGDIDFVRKASETGLTDVELSKLAASHAESASVKKFAETMLTDQTASNDELARIASGRGIQVAVTPAPQQQQQLDQMEALSATDFDRQFADAMVKDHREVIGLFELEATHGQDDDLRAFAQKMLPVLKERADHADDLPPL
jgi:putative membrane protein